MQTQGAAGGPGGVRGVMGARGQGVVTHICGAAVEAERTYQTGVLFMALTGVDDIRPLVDWARRNPHLFPGSGKAGGRGRVQRGGLRAREYRLGGARGGCRGGRFGADMRRMLQGGGGAGVLREAST